MFLSFDLFGQDFIITNSKEEIKAKVIEIDELLVKYKKFDFQEGPIYSVKKSEVFLIIYSNGARETFYPNAIELKNSDIPFTKNNRNPEKEVVNSTNTSRNSSQIIQDNPDKTPKTISKSILFKEGDKFLGIGLGTGVLLGNSSAITTVNIPYMSARFDKVYIQFGENMSAGAGFFAAYHSYSIGILGNESYFNEIYGGISATFYYNISEKFALGAGLRILYASLNSSSNSGYDIGAIGNVNLNVFGSAHYKLSEKLNLFSEFSSGISNINLGFQIHF